MFVSDRTRRVRWGEGDGGESDGGESDGGEGDTFHGDADKRGSRGSLWLEQLRHVSIRASLSNRKWKSTRLNKQLAHKQTNKLVQKHRQRGASHPCWDSWHPSICSSTPQPRSSVTTQSIHRHHLSPAPAGSSCLCLHYVRFVSAYSAQHCHMIRIWMLVVLQAGCCGNTVVAVYWLQLQSETMTTGGHAQFHSFLQVWCFNRSRFLTLECKSIFPRLCSNSVQLTSSLKETEIKDLKVTQVLRAASTVPCFLAHLWFKHSSVWNKQKGTFLYFTGNKPIA